MTTGVCFVRFAGFDCGACRRTLPYAGTHCWAVRDEDWPDFRRTYPEACATVAVPDGALVWALDYRAVDQWVTHPGFHTKRAMRKFLASPPPRMPFDPERHCLVKRPLYEEAWGTYVPVEGAWDFSNPFQVLVEV
jgi:hypothetical protein